MINFFKNIFNTSNKKTANFKNEEGMKIYFDRYKKSHLELKILKEYTCQDIHNYFHNEILGELMKINSSNENLNYNKIFNSNEYSFIILDENNPYIEIKLKPKDTPSRYIKNNSINLYYLNTSTPKKEGDLQNEKKPVENTVDYSIINSSSAISRNSNINMAEDCIREGELLKYSRKHKKFDKRVVVLDKEKLIITKPKNKESTIILLSDISAVSKDISDRSAKDKFTFEIRTIEGDNYIFKSKHNADLESWIESIYVLLSLIRDNKFIIKYSDQINKLVKETYEKGMKIVYNCLSLKGLISIRETRELIYKLYDEKLACSLMESVVMYKTNLRYYKYLDAWANFEEIFDLLDIDHFELSNYYQTVGWGNGSVDGSRGTIYDEVNSYSFDEIRNRSGSINQIRGSVNDFIDAKDVKERKVLLENLKKTPSSKDKEKFIKKENDYSDSKLDMDEQKTEINLCSIKGKCEGAMDENKSDLPENIIKLEYSTRVIIDSKSEKIQYKQAWTYLKHLFSYDYLKYLKNLKIDIKEMIQKYSQEKNDFNSKLNEILKPNLFNELFDNLIIKYFQNFYKSINTNPIFTSRLKNILLYYYKNKNKLTNNIFLDLEGSYYSQNLILKLSENIETKITTDEMNNN